MTAFVDIGTKNNIITLNIVGDKVGCISGKTVSDVCLNFINHFTEEDTIYVNARGIGMLVADTLQKYINVIKIYPQKI